MLEKLTIWEHGETKKSVQRMGPGAPPGLPDNELAGIWRCLISPSSKVSKCWTASVSSSSLKSWHPSSGYLTPKFSSTLSPLPCLTTAHLVHSSKYTTLLESECMAPCILLNLLFMNSCLNQIILGVDCLSPLLEEMGLNPDLTLCTKTNSVR